MSNDVKDFASVDNALTQLGLSGERKLHLYKILAAILFIGNITIDETGENEQCKISANSEKYSDYASNLLNLESNEFKYALCNRVMKMRGTETIVYVMENEYYLIWVVKSLMFFVAFH